MSPQIQKNVTPPSILVGELMTHGQHEAIPSAHSTLVRGLNVTWLALTVFLFLFLFSWLISSR